MHILIVDRIGAHAVWGLMNGVTTDVLRTGGRVSYARMDDGRQRTPLAVPEGVSVHDVMVRRKLRPWDVLTQQNEFCRQLRVKMESDTPDLVHTNFGLPGSATRRMAKLNFDLPVVTTCHELFGSMNVYLRSKVRRTEKFADRIVYISKTVATSYGSSLAKKNVAGDDKERIIYNGVDAEWIRTIAQSAVSPSPNVMVSVGRLVPEKGHSQVIRALPELASQFPTLRYRLIGEGPDRDNLLQLAASLGVEKRVEFAGWLSHEQAIREMATSRVVVMPSRQEGFGLALAEAMCCATRVVASDIPVFAEVVDRKLPTVSFFRIDDLANLTSQLRTALTQTSGPQTCHDECFDLVRHKFSRQKMSSDYVQLYSELAK